MKQKTVFMLKVTTIVASIIVSSLSIAGVYFLANNSINPEYSNMLYPILTGLYISLIPFFIGLFKCFRFLSNFNNHETFETVFNDLKTIKYCSISIVIIYLMMMPFIFILADKDDAPGAILIGMIPIVISIIIVFIITFHQNKMKKKHVY